VTLQASSSALSSVSIPVTELAAAFTLALENAFDSVMYKIYLDAEFSIGVLGANASDLTDALDSQLCTGRANCELTALDHSDQPSPIDDSAFSKAAETALDPTRRALSAKQPVLLASRFLLKWQVGNGDTITKPSIDTESLARALNVRDNEVVVQKAPLLTDLSIVVLPLGAESISSDAIVRLHVALSMALGAPISSVNNNVVDVRWIALPPTPPLPIDSLMSFPPNAPQSTADAAIAPVPELSGVGISTTRSSPLLWLILLLLVVVPLLVLLAMGLYARLRFPGRELKYFIWRFTHEKPSVPWLYCAPETRRKLWQEISSRKPRAIVDGIKIVDVDLESCSERSGCTVDLTQ